MTKRTLFAELAITPYEAEAVIRANLRARCQRCRARDGLVHWLVAELALSSFVALANRVFEAHFITLGIDAHLRLEVIAIVDGVERGH